MYHDSGTREKSISTRVYRIYNPHPHKLQPQSTSMVGVISGYILPAESLHWFCQCWVGPFVPEEIPEVEGPREFNAFVNDILCMIDWIWGLERSKLVPPHTGSITEPPSKQGFSRTGGKTAVIVTGYEDQKKGVSWIRKTTG
ncbi:uncharacterized protein B0H18DRAFT_958814, partial [Fomitopsis serialis]|uniref:uncharacterized protein n=1 Tax=Fomitopsis serialis TaxID=139415 RepID=UPI002007C669